MFNDSYQSNKKHQGIQAFALLNGFYQEDEVAYVLNYMIEQGFSSSIIFGRYVIEALFKFVSNRLLAALFINIIVSLSGIMMASWTRSAQFSTIVPR